MKEWTIWSTVARKKQFNINFSTSLKQKYFLVGNLQHSSEQLLNEHFEDQLIHLVRFLLDIHFFLIASLCRYSFILNKMFYWGRIKIFIWQKWVTDNVYPNVSNQNCVLHTLLSEIWGQMLFHVQKDSNIL